MVWCDDLVTLLFALHASKPYTTADAIWVTQDSSGDHLTKRWEYGLQVALCHVGGQVGYVQVGGVLFLLLKDSKDKK